MKKYIITGGLDANVHTHPDFHTGITTVVAEGNDVSVSDGYHTMDELYDHRIRLWITLCRKSGISWRSKLHADGTMFDGDFILGIGKAEGDQITYHLPIGYWAECDFAEELEHAPEWDGHTPGDVLKRLRDL